MSASRWPDYVEVVAQDDDELPTRIARTVQMQDLHSPWGPTRVRWVAGGHLMRGSKVILNVYDLFPPWLNNLMTCCCLGGAHHSGVEVDEREYQFGGHWDDYQGIMQLPQPLHVLKADALDKLSNPKATQEEKRKARQEALFMPTLRQRHVLGFWLGSRAEWNVLMHQLKDEEQWLGPSYKMLSRNCNHWVQSLSVRLLQHAKFAPASNFDALMEQATHTTTKLTELAKCCCCPCLTRLLDMRMRPAAHQLDVWRGQAHKLGGTPCPAAEGGGASAAAQAAAARALAAATLHAARSTGSLAHANGDASHKVPLRAGASLAADEEQQLLGGAGAGAAETAPLLLHPDGGEIVAAQAAATQAPAQQVMDAGEGRAGLQAPQVVVLAGDGSGAGGAVVLVGGSRGSGSAAGPGAVQLAAVGQAAPLTLNAAPSLL